MKRIALLLALLCLAAVACGPDKVESVTLEWHSFSEVARYFPMAPRPMFLYVSEAGCHYCEEMDSAVFARPEVADYLNRNFFPVKIDVSTEMPIKVRDSVMTEGEFRKLMGIQGIPALYFFETNGRPVGAHDQSLDLRSFKQMMLYVHGGHFGRTPLRQWLQTPEADLDTVYGVF
jgi:thioredoxin-related protein